MKNYNRRQFLGRTSASLALGSTALSTLAGTKAHAANPDYKAIICIFFKGGLDGFDTVIPYDEMSYDALKAYRSNIFESYRDEFGYSSRDRENLLPLNPINSANFGTRQMALPKDLQPIHDMFESNELSILSGIGPLIEPTNRTTFNKKLVKLPPRLNSHNDQQTYWGTLATEGARHGWGGKFLDSIYKNQSTASSAFSAITAAGPNPFLFGEKIAPIKVGIGAPAGLSAITAKKYLGYSKESDKARQILEAYVAKNYSSDNIYARDLNQARNNAKNTSDFLRTSYKSTAEISTQFPTTKLGKQLQAIVQTIKMQSTIGVNRQIFYASIGGFDTHSNASVAVPNRHKEIASAITALKAGLLEVGMWDNVTTYTASDFGRTLLDNGSGTDHAWANSQFVFGGSVKGRHIYGRLPEMDNTSEHYTGRRGRWIPTLSVEQLAATLGTWFGVNNADMHLALPNLSNFDHQDLGFLS